MVVSYFLFYFQFVLILVAAHVAHHHLVAWLEAAHHFHIFKVRVTEFHLTRHDFVFAIEYKEFLIATTYVVRSIGNAHHVFLYGIHHIHIGFQA